MFGRPRCREWTPLATQQLRLRSLIQIVGYNIRPPEWCNSPCSFYLTLHHTTMCAPFYTSERISSPHPKWKEIDCEITQRMSSANVVVRIWCHVIHPTSTSDNSSEKSLNIQDTVIQTWGVYFSGLRYIGPNLSLNFTSDCFKSNTLVFQMHGGYFCSYKSLKLDVIPPENELEHGSLSSESSGKTNLSNKITNESKFVQSHALLKESRSVSPNKYSKRNDKEYSKSQSPVDKCFKQSFPTMRSSSSLSIVQQRRRDNSSERNSSEPNHIYEHSPENSDVKENRSVFSKNASQEFSASKVDLSETAESYDLRNESDWSPKYRYLALNFLKSEIRPSYNATKLQKLHLLQYSIKKRQEAVQEVKERIYKKSALTNVLEEDGPHDGILKFKSRSQRNLFSPDEGGDGKEKSASQTDLSAKNGRIKVEEKPIVSNGPRLTLKLNDLLSFKAKPSPFQRAEHVRLTKHLEILRFKRIILADERDSKLVNIRRLKERYNKLLEENQDLELMQDYHALSRHNEVLKETRLSCSALRELAARSHAALGARRAELLHDLAFIFHIEQKDQSWSICGIPLAVCGDERPRSWCALREAAAAGLAAQALCAVAALAGLPLRYRITLLGSASKVLDVAELPDPNIPLFARGGDITLFRYAMFLLNKCIAQLMHARGLAVTDMRPTLANLQKLMCSPSHLSDTSKLFGTYKWLGDSECPRTQSLRSLVASERGKYGRQFNRFKDAVEGQSPQSLMSLQKHRHSRSVGSYQDDNELSEIDASTTSIMGSEPNIYNSKLSTVNSEDLTKIMKSHNSDSEISKLNDGNKVVFTLGDDTKLMNLESQKLVRISSNNGDCINSAYVEENVKQICSEIKDFCSLSSDDANNEIKDQINKAYDVAKHIEAINENIDIAKYMEARKSSVDIEDSRTCENCEQDGVCDVRCANNVVEEVIVIPSAEAKIDTGQDILNQSIEEEV